jgi:zinc transport system substrate-binding protein
MRDFRNTIFVLIVIVFIVQMIVMKQDAQKEQEPLTPAKTSVALSTFSLYDIAKNIAGDTMELVMIMPFGVDAHSFEPTPQLMVKISQSSLVVYSGAGLEPWIDGFEFKNSVVDMSKHVKLREIDAYEREGHEHHDHQCVHNKIDPHYWLDIQNMIIATRVMRDKFIEIKPKNKEIYTKNSELYIERLRALDKEFQTKLSSCQNKTIVVNHNAFAYVSKRYGFEVEALSGLSPEAEPSAQNMARLIEHIKEHNVQTLFFESFVSDRAIKSIASDSGVMIDVLQPLGNITADEAENNSSYTDIMQRNLDKISKALMCR